MKYRTIFKALKIQEEIVILQEIQELQDSVPRLYWPNNIRITKAYTALARYSGYIWWGSKNRIACNLGSVEVQMQQLTYPAVKTRTPGWLDRDFHRVIQNWLCFSTLQF